MDSTFEQLAEKYAEDFLIVSPVGEIRAAGRGVGMK